MVEIVNKALPAVRFSQTCPTAPPKSPPRCLFSRPGSDVAIPLPTQSLAPLCRQPPRQHAPGASLKADSSQTSPAAPRHCQGRTHQQPRDTASSSRSRSPQARSRLPHVSLQPTFTPQPCASLQRGRPSIGTLRTTAQSFRQSNASEPIPAPTAGQRTDDDTNTDQAKPTLSLAQNFIHLRNPIGSLVSLRQPPSSTQRRRGRSGRPSRTPVPQQNKGRA